LSQAQEFHHTHQNVQKALPNAKIAQITDLPLDVFLAIHYQVDARRNLDFRHEVVSRLSFST
jgi:hypothetical protein